MNLIELIDKSEIKPTGERKRFTISGLNHKTNNIYEVYAIPVDYLYYNDQNGRINTTYMKYKAKNKEVTPEKGDSEYNKLFQKFIYESNEAALKKTKLSIEEKGQQEPGVVLPDGRIIDGNRRFTALRMMQKEESVEQFFFAIVLPIDNQSEADKKVIKTLELDLQLGREEKVDYDPIDKIYDVYDTVIIRKQMTAQEYRKAAGYGNVTPVNNDIKRAELMIKFIDIISPGENPENKFYLIKDLKLDGPIKEIDRTIIQLKSDNKVALTEAILTHMLLTKTDLIKEEPTKAMRNLVNNVIGKRDFVDRYLNAVDGRVDVLIDAFEDKPITSANEINEIIYNDEEVLDAAQRMVKTTNQLIYKGGLDTEKTRVLAELKDILERLENIDTEDFCELNVENKIESREVISNMIDAIHKMKRAL